MTHAVLRGVNPNLLFFELRNKELRVRSYREFPDEEGIETTVFRAPCFPDGLGRYREFPDEEGIETFRQFFPTVRDGPL